MFDAELGQLVDWPEGRPVPAGWVRCQRQPVIEYPWLVKLFAELGVRRGDVLDPLFPVTATGERLLPDLPGTIIRVGLDTWSQWWTSADRKRLDSWGIAP